MSEVKSKDLSKVTILIRKQNFRLQLGGNDLTKRAKYQCHKYPLLLIGEFVVKHVLFPDDFSLLLVIGEAAVAPFLDVFSPPPLPPVLSTVNQQTIMW